MEKNLLVICDLEADYAANLADYLSRKKNVPFEVHAFTRTELLSSFAVGRQIDLMLLSREACYELKKMDGDVKARDVFVLSGEDGREEELFQGYRCLYKYQSAESILREVMNRYAEETAPVASRMRRTATSKLLAVYSPVRRTLKTSFAMTLGQVLSREKRALYINLEEYSGFNSLLKRSYSTDMSDLMYYISQKKPNFIWKLSSLVQQVGGLDYIPPAISPPDIRTIPAGSWMEFFSQLSDCGYDDVILDMGETVNGLFDILRMCDRIYMPVRDDAVSYAKLEQYEALLRSMDYGDLLEKTRKLSFSGFKGTWQGLDRLLYSELGSYARRLAKEEGL